MDRAFRWRFGVGWWAVVRFGLPVIAAVLTAVPFAGVHMPLLLIADHITTWSVFKGIGGLLILGVVVRLLIGVVMRAAADSVLAVGVLHQFFDASNKEGGVVDSFLDGADEGDGAYRHRAPDCGRRGGLLETSRLLRQTGDRDRPL
jgi:hypothetical protein